jgi:hypothetical protein
MMPNDKAHAQRHFDALCEEHQPETDYEERLLRQVANAWTLAERCQNVIYVLQDDQSLSAELYWERDQAIAAEQLALKLPKNPSLVSKQLEETPQGVAWLDDRWTRLGQVLEKTGTWTESRRTLALDLLGVPAEFRDSGCTPIDPQYGEDFRTFAQAIVQKQLQRLRDPQARDLAKRYDGYRRDVTIGGHPVVIRPEVRLTKRYESMHWRRADRAMDEFHRVREARHRPQEQAKAAAGSAGRAGRAAQSPLGADFASIYAAAMKAAEAATVPASGWWSPVSNPKPSPTSHQGSQRDREAQRDARKQPQKQQR